MGLQDLVWVSGGQSLPRAQGLQGGPYTPSPPASAQGGARGATDADGDGGPGPDAPEFAYLLAD